jgi:hypothetical protein
MRETFGPSLSAVCVASVSVEGYVGIVRYCISVYDIGTYPYLGAQGVWEYLRGMLEVHWDIDEYMVHEHVSVYMATQNGKAVLLQSLLYSKSAARPLVPFEFPLTTCRSRSVHTNNEYAFSL